jgi:hypothetical protein
MLILIVMLLNMPAYAVTINNTFTGVVVQHTLLYPNVAGACDTICGGGDTTDDFGSYFGGGSLLGKAFTLIFTLDTDVINNNFNLFGGNPAITEGGLFYPGNPPNPIIMQLTIDGYTFYMNNDHTRSTRSITSSYGFYLTGDVCLSVSWGTPGCFAGDPAPE